MQAFAFVRCADIERDGGRANTPVKGDNHNDNVSATTLTHITYLYMSLNMDETKFGRDGFFRAVADSTFLGDGRTLHDFIVKEVGKMRNI